MKIVALGPIFLLAGCVSVPADPAKITLVVEPVKQICGASDRSVPVRLTVKNRSRGKLKLWIDEDARKPPYELSWLAYQVLGAGRAVDWEHGPGGHGPMPPSTLSIGPGDSTKVVAPLYALAPADYSGSFRIQLKDLAGHSFVSSLFKPCTPKLLPAGSNNSSKPTPLRGAA